MAGGVLVLWLVLGVFDFSGRFRPAEEVLVIPLDGEVVQLLRAGVPEPIFTDRPIYTSVTYRAHEPWWAVLSDKRIVNEPAFAERFPGMLDAAGVTTVVLDDRWPIERFGAPFAEWLAAEFVRIDEPGGAGLFVRRTAME